MSTSESFKLPEKELDGLTSVPSSALLLTGGMSIVKPTFSLPLVYIPKRYQHKSPNAQITRTMDDVKTTVHIGFVFLFISFSHLKDESHKLSSKNRHHLCETGAERVKPTDYSPSFFLAPAATPPNARAAPAIRIA